MADRWMDERDRRWRDRDWRRSEDLGRDGDDRRFQGGEDRSFGGGSDERDAYGARRSGPERDRVFGERETGMGYGGGSYGSGEGYRSTYGGGRSGAYRGEGEAQGRGGYSGGDDRPRWQDRDYGGVSPAMQQGEYDAERRAERYQREHGFDEQERRFREERKSGRSGSGQGGRYLGDGGREAIYREEWSQGRRDTGPAPRGYDAGADRDHRRGHFAEDYSFGSGALTSGDASGYSSGGTGGYDYERGYGDGGRRFDERRDRGWRGEEDRDRDRDRGERFEQAGRDTGDWFRKAGERVASWFGGGETRRDEDRSFDRDRGRGYQGMGPKGYQRPDERINEEAHERLTDDSWLDASNISVSVSGGEVTLSGTVENREAKHRAERIVEDISGVKHVQNNLRVEEGNPLTTPGRGYGDSVLEQQMRETDIVGKTGPDDSGTRTSTSKPTGSSTSTDTGKSR